MQHYQRTLMTLSARINTFLRKELTEEQQKLAGAACMLSGAGTAVRSGYSKEEFLSAASSLYDIALAAKPKPKKARPPLKVVK